MARFSASSYRAAGWQRIGETVKRSDKTIKDVYVKPLADDARRILLEGEAKKPRRVAPRQPTVSAADDRFVRMWRDFVGIAAEVAEQYDRRWQQRRRVLVLSCDHAVGSKPVSARHTVGCISRPLGH